MSPDLESLADRVSLDGLALAVTEAGAGEALESALAELSFADALRRSAERLSHSAAASARALGASWREIGTAVGGITPQGAEHRFSAAAKERRSKAAKAEWAERDRRKATRNEPSAERSFTSERAQMGVGRRTDNPDEGSAGQGAGEVGAVVDGG